MYLAAEVLGAGEFDLVYTGVGSLSWLPDIRRWGGVVADLLRPGGRLFIREDHPVLLSAKVRDGLLTLERPYFEQSEPNVAKSRDVGVPAVSPTLLGVNGQHGSAFSPTV